MNSMGVQESPIQAAQVHKFPFQCLQHSNIWTITFSREMEECYISMQQVNNWLTASAFKDSKDAYDFVAKWYLLYKTL